ncbi:unnamed protein product [Amoebophrya sp. A120]|nr:unnamed protein product [Amoebophrya sp. A120]|eukprot:GSA120T00006763001.1
MEKIIMMKASRRAGVTTLLLGGLLALSSGSRVSALSLQARAPGSRSSAQPNEVDEREEDEECAGLSVYKKFTRGHPITGDDCLKGIGEFCNSFCSQPNKVAEARAQTGVQTYTDHGQEGFDPLLAAVEDVRPPPRRPTPASLTDDASSAVDEAGLGLDAAAPPVPTSAGGRPLLYERDGKLVPRGPAPEGQTPLGFPNEVLDSLDEEGTKILGNHPRKRYSIAVFKQPEGDRPKNPNQRFDIGHGVRANNTNTARRQTRSP